MHPGDQVTVTTRRADGSGPPVVYTGILKNIARDRHRDDVSFRGTGAPFSIGGSAYEELELTVSLSTAQTHEPEWGRNQFERKLKSKSTRKKARASKEKNMERFTAEVILHQERKLVSIHVTDKDGKYLNRKGEWMERALGEEMPVYATMPQEIFEAVVAAA